MNKLMLIGLVCAVLLFGCSGQQTAAPTAPAPTPAKTAPAPAPAAPANAPAPAPTPAAPAQANNASAGTNPAPEQPSAAPSSASDALLGALTGNSGYKVVYQVTAGTAASYEMTEYLKGGNMRTDIALSGMQSRTYVISGKVTSCILAGTTWSCNALPSQNTQSVDIGEQLKADPSKYAITADGTQTVAGVAATCYKVVGTDATVRYCISSEGVPLYVKTTAQGMDVVMQATSYSTSVTDADFALPA